MRDDPRPHAAASGRTFPGRRQGSTVRAHRSRREPEPAALGAPLQHELVPRGGRPELLRRVVGGGDRPQRLPAHPSLLRTRALVGTPFPLVTRTVSHRDSWFTLSPRSCRTPSRIRFIPWTYASERQPPAVFDGSEPPFTASSPSAAKGPPSP